MSFNQDTWLDRLLTYLRDVNFARFKRDLYPGKGFHESWVLARFQMMQNDLSRWFTSLDPARRRRLVNAVDGLPQEQVTDGEAEEAESNEPDNADECDMDSADDEAEGRNDGDD
jgi:hypothetical protein